MHFIIKVTDGLTYNCRWIDTVDLLILLDAKGIIGFG